MGLSGNPGDKTDVPLLIVCAADHPGDTKALAVASGWEAVSPLRDGRCSLRFRPVVGQGHDILHYAPTTYLSYSTIRKTLKMHLAV